MHLSTELLESFALSDERDKALEQLIPGTEEHFFLACLHLQQQARPKEAAALLEAWKGRHGRTEAWERMRDRQALLGWEQDPADTVKRLRERIGPHLSHAREVEDERPRWPTRLDPERLDRTRLLRAALEGHSHLSNFTPAADAPVIAATLPSSSSICT